MASKFFQRLICLICLMLASTSHANEIIISTHINAGGPYILARIFAKHMPKHLPANHDVVIKTVPGAGGIVNGNYIYNIAPRDGSVIGIFNSDVPLFSVMKNKNINFEIDKFTWIGSAIDGRQEPYMFWVRTGSTEFIAGTTTPGVFDYVDLINIIAKLNIKKVSGYSDANMIRMALERNEVNSAYHSYSGIKTNAKHWLNKDSQIAPILQWGNGTSRVIEFSGVKTLSEYVSSDQERALLEFIELSMILLRPYFAPPDIPKEKAAMLRTAFENSLKDKEFLMDANKSNIEISFVDHTTAQLVMEKFVRFGKDPNIQQYLNK